LVLSLLQFDLPSLLLFVALLLLPKLVLLLALALILSLRSWDLLTLFAGSSKLPLARRSNRRLASIQSTLFLLRVDPIDSCRPGDSCSSFRVDPIDSSCSLARRSNRRFFSLLVDPVDALFMSSRRQILLLVNSSIQSTIFLSAPSRSVGTKLITSLSPSAHLLLRFINPIDVFFNHGLDHPAWHARWGQFLVNGGQLLKRPACLMKQFSLLEIVVVLMLAAC